MERKIIYASDASEAVSKAYNIQLHELVDLFAEVPTVEPKHGKWEWESTHKLGLDYGGTGYIPNFKCSVCECITESYIRFDEPHEIDADYPNFCPNCGADMGGSKDD